MLSNTIPLERREYTPVEIEVAKSVKQESRHFSDERFKVLLCMLLAFMTHGVQSYDTNRKIREMDNDPNCTIKSDRWKRENGLL